MGRVQHPLRGTPPGDRLCTPLPNSSQSRAGAGPDPEPRRVFPAPVPVQEAPEQPRLRPRAQCWEHGGGTGTPGHGDLSQSSAFNCFSTPPWARLNARGPRCPCVPHPHPGLNPDPQGKRGCSSHLLGVPFQPSSGGTLAAPQPRGVHRAPPGHRLAGPLFGTSRPPLGIEEHLSAGPEIKQYMGNSSGSGSGESPGRGPVPQQKEVSL